MFRLVVDIATVELLPIDEADRPNAKTCRDLGLRLPWLFENAEAAQPVERASAAP